MKAPLVTVLMSVYNNEEYLAEAVDSILAQTYQNLEFLIINDASTDSSATILASYKDSRINVIYNDINIGLTKSLNIGLKHTKGKYIARMDADDISYPQRLERQVAFMEMHPEVGLCGSWAVDRHENSLKERKFPCEDYELRFGLLRHNPFVHSSIMLRAHVIEENQIQFDSDFIYAQDFALWAKVAEYTKLANLPEFLIEYRIHDQQLTKERFGQQENYVKETLRYQLTKLDIQATPEELSLHYSILNRLNERLNNQDIAQGHCWLILLLNKNRYCQIYEPSYFFEKLEDCWSHLLYLNPVLDKEVLQLIIRSPFRIMRLSDWRLSLLLLGKITYFKVVRLLGISET